MTHHHERGTAMARHAAENGTLEPLREIGKDTMLEQVKDISKPQRLLASQDAQLPPFP